MTIERCQRCFGQVLNGKCSCGLHTTVVTTPLSSDETLEEGNCAVCHGFLHKIKVGHSYEVCPKHETHAESTPLGKKLRDIRKNLEDSGKCTLSPEDVRKEVQERRGELEDLTTSEAIDELVHQAQKLKLGY